MSRWNKEEMYSITYLVRTILLSSCLGEVVGVQAGGGSPGGWWLVEIR
jgi:hypothetical protein